MFKKIALPLLFSLGVTSYPLAASEGPSRAVEKESHYFELGVKRTEFDGSGVAGFEDSGTSMVFNYRLAYKDALGYEAGFQYMEYEGVDMHLGNLGMNYTFSINDGKAYFMPQAGLYHMDVGGFDDGDIYFGVEAGVKDVLRNTSVAVYVQHYEMKYDDIMEEERVGFRVSHQFDEDFGVAFNYEDWGVTDSYMLSAKFFF